MKKLLLPLICLLALAAPSFAEEDSVTQSGGSYSTPEEYRRKHNGPNDDVPVAPVPEPGTMALASMGLIALGAAARQRRNK